MPVIPQLRALQMGPQETSLSESSSFDNYPSSTRIRHRQYECLPVSRSMSSPISLSQYRLWAQTWKHPVMEPAVAREILQKWVENLTESGNVERTHTHTQVARIWPLENDIKFDNIEAAIQVLRQACDYLHQGTRHVGSVVEKKADAERVQGMANAMSEVVEQVRRIHEQLLGGSQKAEVMSATVGQISEKISDAHSKIEHVGNRVEQKLSQQRDTVQST